VERRECGAHVERGATVIKRLRVTVLADNFVAVPDLLAEHGLAMLIEADDWRILFDTGQGNVLRSNADALGLSLCPLDALVLSHGHYDHTGGLAGLLREVTPSAIFLHPAALQRKYARNDGPPNRSIGIPENSRQALDTLQDRIVWTQSATEVVPGVWCTGEIPRLAVNGQRASGYFLDAECREPDPIADDQALFIETTSGLVVIAGCAHSGVVNTLDHVSALTGHREALALVGGLHLGRATRQELEICADAIASRNCRTLAPCHCTGMGAHSHLRTRFPSMVRDVGVGTELVW
jgi:7,8-dihydropterin-6-yl-methyl-4-(beta-D-ribofuranosyl)aminobenzene 5'-phosphate synthase